MSEYQNNAVELLKARFGATSVLDKDARRTQFLQEALELYRAMGGSAEMVRVQVGTAFSEPAGDVHAKIGEVMNALAGVSLAHDVDVVQAGYNSLDDGWKKLGVVYHRKSQRQF